MGGSLEKTVLWGEETRIELGLMPVEDLAEFAHSQYTDYGTRECPEKTIDLLEWFDSRTNDWYLIESESDPDIVILVGNGPYAAYRKSDIKKNRFATIG